MCGRTRLSVPPSDLAEIFSATLSPMPENAHAGDAVNLNCAPTDPILVVRRARDSDSRELVLVRWGLVPFYVRDFRDCKPMINARVETVAHHKAFRASFKKRRCLVIADGFYEWRADPDKKRKLPFVIQRPSRAPFGMAGLWDRWKGDKGERLETCTIITRTPSAEVAAVHDRMPLALDESDHEAWLDPETDEAKLDQILSRAIIDWVVTPIDRVPDSSRKKQLVLARCL
jgi:putative SOS response-associated peptidase YedK